MTTPTRTPVPGLAARSRGWGTTPTSVTEGLTTQQVMARREQFGPNEIHKAKPIRVWDIVREELTEPMMVLLILAGLAYSALGEARDALAILIIIALLIGSEVFTEYRAKRAIAALERFVALTAHVLRDRRIVDVDASDVVPGDVLILSPGTKLAADARVQTSVGLQVDESALTGESLPVDKTAGNTAGNDEASCVYAGTFIRSGEGQAVVTATGAHTRLGQIAAKTGAISPPRTTLQLAMKSLAGKLVYVAVFFAVAIPILGIIRGQDWKLMFLTGLALAFAVIPEELPIVITMVLGLGSYTLSKQRFLIKQLRTAEALGNVTTIVTDKTGTLTEGRLTIAAAYPDRDSVLQAAFLSTPEYALTSIDVVIKHQASALGLPDTILRERDLLSKKTRAIIRRNDDAFTLYVSGAPEAVFEACGLVPEDARSALERQTAAGRRVIAVASKSLTAIEAHQEFERIETGLTLAGLIAFEDAPRPGVWEAIAKVVQAGIRPVMVTGDHPLTATYVAKQVGISTGRVLTGNDLELLSDEALRQTVLESAVFARSTPEHKYRIVRALQANHEVVAVTGDGINDVLALKAADIGIAMGIKGTDVAKDAASVVLADDNFNTIAMGIFEGRAFFDNLQKGMKYYLCVKLALILIFLIPVIGGMPLPFAPIQLIVLELFMDLAASAAFVAEPKEPMIYSRPPRDPKENVLNSRALRDILVKASVLFAAVAGVYIFAYQHTGNLIEAQTLAFTAWIVGHIVLAFISRSDTASVIAVGAFKNRVMTLWAVAAIGFVLLGIYVPTLNALLRLTVIPVPNLLLTIAFVSALISTLEVWKALVQRAAQAPAQALPNAA